MAGKSDKKDKGAQSAKHSESSDHRSNKGKKGGKGKNSGKSGKSGKSEKPTVCLSDWAFQPLQIDGETGLILTGEIAGTLVCDAAELSTITIDYSPVAGTFCSVDEEVSPIPGPELDGTYILTEPLLLRCDSTVS